MVKTISRFCLKILSSLLRSFVIAAIVSGFSGVIILQGIEVFAGSVLFSLLLLPSIFLYHFATLLKLRSLLCSVFYFVPFFAVETYLVVVATVASRSTLSDDGGEMCKFAALVIAIAGMFVYLVEYMIVRKKTKLAKLSTDFR